jgi:hypothetical protein
VRLVQHDKSQAGHWGEKSRPWPDDHIYLTTPHLLPDRIPMAKTQLAVYHTYSSRESRFKSAHGLRGETDFRHQYDGPASLCQGRFHSSQIELRFARSSDSMEQNGTVGPFEVALDLTPSTPLVRRQLGEDLGLSLHRPAEILCMETD